MEGSCSGPRRCDCAVWVWGGASGVSPRVGRRFQCPSGLVPGEGEQLHPGASDTYVGPDVVQSLADDDFEVKEGDLELLQALWRANYAEIGGFDPTVDVDLRDPRVAADVVRYAAAVRARDKGEAPLLQIQPNLDALSVDLIFSLLPPDVRGKLRYLHLDYGQETS